MDQVDKAKAWDELAKKNAEIKKLTTALTQIRARANSFQNVGSHSECLRQFACIDHIAASIGIQLIDNGQGTAK